MSLVWEYFLQLPTHPSSWATRRGSCVVSGLWEGEAELGPCAQERLTLDFSNQVHTWYVLRLLCLASSLCQCVWLQTHTGEGAQVTLDRNRDHSSRPEQGRGNIHYSWVKSSGSGACVLGDGTKGKSSQLHSGQTQASESFPADQCTLGLRNAASAEWPVWNFHTVFLPDLWAKALTLNMVWQQSFFWYPWVPKMIETYSGITWKPYQGNQWENIPDRTSEVFGPSDYFIWGRYELGQRAWLSE